jgi:hypothetical protein
MVDVTQNDKITFKNYPVCDTNILIDLQLGNVFERFLTNENKINIVDKVLDEMRNLFSYSPSYGQLLLTIEKNANVYIVPETIFTSDQQSTIKHTLKMFPIKNFFGKKAFGKDVGEFASAVYAIYLQIQQFYTNDKKFIEKYQHNPFFTNLLMLNLNDILNKFLSNPERIRANQIIETKNSKMDRILKQEKNAPPTKEQLLEQLAAYLH